MNILHINDKITISGGVEVYINQLMTLLPKYNLNAFWYGMIKNKSEYIISDKKTENQQLINTDSLKDFVEHIVATKEIDVIHIHSISDYKIIDICTQVRPVIRSMHEPRIVCPGQGKFLRKSEIICDKRFGLHCIYDAYKEGCCNRHPIRLSKALFNTYYEVHRASKKYKAVLVMSNYMENQAVKAGIEQSKIVLNPYFTIDDTIEFHQDDKKMKRILFVGRLSKTKGVHYFIKVAKILLADNKNLVFDIVGDGHDGDYFKKLVPSDLAKHIVFHGWQSREQITQHLHRAHILAFTSIYPEAFGITGIEAMMHGKPVVGFDVGGVSTWLKDKNTGYLIPVKNTMLMSEKIQHLIDDEVEYQNFSDQSRLFALENFTPDVHFKKLHSLYKSIIK